MGPISHPQCVVTSILANLLVVGAVGVAVIGPHLAVAAGGAIVHGAPPLRIKPTAKPRLDLSGRTRIGIASFYADFFAGRKMANGAAMNPRSNNAASRTLPLGTIARVTNLKTHKSAVITIQDRGPYVSGRIIDLSPATAEDIGIARKEGLAAVRVTPIAMPPRKGRVYLANRSIRSHRCDQADCDGLRIALEQRSTNIE